MRNILLYFTKKHKGNWEAIYQSIVNKEQAIQIKKDVKNYISLIDESYPKQYKRIYKPPFSIFTYGNKKLLNSLNIIGLYGVPSCKDDIKILKSSTTIYVLDYKNKSLIEEFLKNNIQFIACSAHGISNEEKNSFIYKQIIKKNNLIITEIPNYTNEYYCNQFHWRLIFGLTKTILFLSKEDKELIRIISHFSKIEDFDCFSIVKINDKNIKYCKTISYFCSEKIAN